MIDDSTFRLLVAAWLAVAVLIVMLQHRQSPRRAGLVLCWVLSLALIHWLPALVYALPWYTPANSEPTQLGFLQSLYAVAGFGVGVLFLSLRLRFPNPFARVRRTTTAIQDFRSVSIMYL